MKRLAVAVLIFSGAVSITLGQSEEKKALPREPLPSPEAEHRSKMWQVLELRMRKLREIEPVDASQVGNLEKLYSEAKDRNWNYGELERLLVAVESFMARHTTAKTSSTPSIKADYLEKAFALKMTKTKVMAGDLIITFEFLEDSKDLAKLLDAIRPVQDPDGPKQEPKQHDPKLPEIFVYGFDAENVPVLKRTISAITAADITGKKGDAFRLTVKGICKGPDGEITKVEFRPKVQTATRPAIGQDAAFPIPATHWLPALPQPSADLIPNHTRPPERPPFAAPLVDAPRQPTPGQPPPSPLPPLNKPPR